jgi:hypothetical protein
VTDRSTSAVGTGGRRDAPARHPAYGRTRSRRTGGQVQLTLVEKGASIRHICLEPNSIRDQWVHQSRFI